MKIINVIIIGLAIFTSCTTEEEPKPEMSNEEMLAGSSSKNWSLTYQETYQDGQKVGEGDALACDTDNVFTFNVNGNYTMSEGATKCDDSNPSELDGQWTFSDDYTKLFVNAGNIQTMYAVITLSADKMVVDETTYWYVIRHTFVKK